MKDTRKPYELLVIGGSAGSLSVVLNIIPLLKKKMNICVIVIFHRKTTEDTGLIEMMSHRTELEVKDISDKDDLAPGTLYIAPADYHILIEKDKTITLDDSEKINYSRPSIDVTFESAADIYGKKLMCVLLSGANADGVNGLVYAQKLGAHIVVQDPTTAEVPYMPQTATGRVTVDLLLNENDLQPFVDELSGN